MKLSYGVGYNSKGDYPVIVAGTGRKTRTYQTWNNMLRRCYCPASLIKRPTYKGVTVCDSWLDYQNFAKWYENQEFNDIGYCLDKDILQINNKIYSPDNSCLIPQEINKLMNGYKAGRGNLKIGVFQRKPTSKYLASISIDGSKKHIGYYVTEEEAHRAFLHAKTDNIIRVANRWKGKIDNSVYLALINWDFNQRLVEEKWGLA